ncbi:hypothetical protein HanXRQr2_Chr04g0151801 [Helianthus annuus]|uniref:Uncharacterized protein n=1 Tax=Helianthus annuus TaxID=4232 RepID=A0A9K3NR90_HELAN|nr:hypothetical protein HanXRQr2_Chr04g0151801 [Helianthus annuus]KAJ0930163.1 hypothetical protein HanPSC8_Chr04g0146151 [Helianthus annuus]
MDIAWETIGNSIDYGILAMHHMETWKGITEDRWCWVPTEPKKIKTRLTFLDHIL